MTSLCKKLLFILCMLVCISGYALGQESADGVEGLRIEIPSSFNPVGSGARALGMGSAFIAVADDATAASWNPGGLVQLGRPECSVVGAFFNRTEENQFKGTPFENASGAQEVDETHINYLSLSYPFTLLKRNMVLSLNYQHLFDFTREWNFPVIERSSQTSALWDVRYKQEGRLSAVGLAYCIQMTPSLSFGFTLNFWEDWLTDNEWEQTRHEKAEGVDLTANTLFTYQRDQKSRYSFSGFNANLGILWNINEKFSFGAVLKTPFTADLKYESWTDYAIRYPGSPDYDSVSSDTSYDNQKLDMPMAYGVGASFRFSDKLTFSLDIYRTEWQDFILEDSKGNKTCPISQRPAEESDVEPTHQVRFGAEYLFYDPVKSDYIIPVRVGLFYDPAPAEGNPDDFYGFSLGSGIVIGKVVFDIAYQYRFGNNVGTYILEDQGFSQDVKEHAVYSSLVIHF